MRSKYNSETFWDECTEVGGTVTDCWELIGKCEAVEAIYKECVDFNDWSEYNWLSVGFAGRYSHVPTKEHFPATIKWFEDKGYSHPELMKLDPWSHIDPHVHDFKPRIPYMYNMSINYPLGCKFGILPAGLIPFTAGDIYKIDIYSDHAVINNSDKTRYHLVFQE